MSKLLKPKQREYSEFRNKMIDKQKVEAEYHNHSTSYSKKFVAGQLILFMKDNVQITGRILNKIQKIKLLGLLS